MPAVIRLLALWFAILLALGLLVGQGVAWIEYLGALLVAVVGGVYLTRRVLHE